MIIRPFLWMAVVFLLGDVWGLCRWRPLPAALLPGLAAALLLAVRRRKRGTAAVSVSGLFRYGCLPLLLFSAMFVLGADRAENALARRETVLSGIAEDGDCAVRGTIVKKERQKDKLAVYLEKACIFPGQSSVIHSENCGDIRVILPSDLYPMGTTLIVKGKLNKFETAANEGGFDQRQFYNSQGIWGELWEPKICRAQSVPMSAFARSGYDLREWLYQRRTALGGVLAKLLDTENAGVLGGMLLGDKSRVDAEARLAYRNAGISHILAISALHIAIFAMSLYRFLRKRGIGFLTSGLVSSALIGCYGVMTGYSVSTGRAIAMFVVMVLGAAAGRSYDLLSALGAWVLVALWDNPFLPENSGFVFSVTAVLGIGVTVRILQSGEREGRARPLALALVSGVGIQLTTLPLVAFYYYEIPTYAVFLNLVVIPLMSPVLISGALGVLLGSLSLPLGRAAIQPAGLILSGYRLGCDKSLELPGAQIIVGRPKAWELFAYYAILGIALLLLWRRREGEAAAAAGVKPRRGADVAGKEAAAIAGAEPRRGAAEGRGAAAAAAEPRRGADVAGKEAAAAAAAEPRRGAAEGRGAAAVGRRLAGVLAAGLLLGLLYHPRPLLREVDFLDVGQGLGVCLATEDGRCIFMDGGSTSEKNVGNYRILPFLKSRGIRQVDYWCFSHGDADHINGALEVFASGYPVKNLVLAEAMPRDEAWRQLVDTAAQNGSRICYIRRGQSLRLGEESLECVFPGGGVGQKKTEGDTEDRNRLCLVLLFRGERYSALFPGDISAEEEEKLVRDGGLGAVDIYAAAHHGSKYSNSAAFLRMIRPACAVISCGKNNRYGHPGREALEHMRAVGAKIYDTRDRGEVRIRVR